MLCRATQASAAYQRRLIMCMNIDDCASYTQVMHKLRTGYACDNHYDSRVYGCISRVIRST